MLLLTRSQRELTAEKKNFVVERITKATCVHALPDRRNSARGWRVVRIY